MDDIKPVVCVPSLLGVPEPPKIKSRNQFQCKNEQANIIVAYNKETNQVTFEKMYPNFLTHSFPIDGEDLDQLVTILEDLVIKKV